MERRKNVVNKVLNVPIHMGSMASNVEGEIDQIKSIWVATRDDNMVFHNILSILSIFIYVTYIIVNIYH